MGRDVSPVSHLTLQGPERKMKVGEAETRGAGEVCLVHDSRARGAVPLYKHNVRTPTSCRPQHPIRRWCRSGQSLLWRYQGTNVFLKREEPTYRTGFSTGLGLCAMGMIAATTMFIGTYIGNKQRDRRRKELPEVLDEGSVEDLGEKHPDFRYSL